LAKGNPYKRSLHNVFCTCPKLQHNIGLMITLFYLMMVWCATSLENWK